MIKVGIIGANGYLGIELIRILSVHPEVKLSKIFQREMEIDEEFPHLQSYNLKDLQTSTLDDFKNLDCVFLSLPHGCLLYTSPSPRDRTRSRMPSSA